MNKLERNMGYEFKNVSLLKTALTHSSYANEAGKGTKYNERLEFLGDSVLSIIVSEYLFEAFPEELCHLAGCIFIQLACFRLLFLLPRHVSSSFPNQCANHSNGIFIL